MTEEEIQELERLTNEYNSWVARRNQLVEQYNALVVELQYSVNATIDTINYATKVRNYVVPRLGASAESVTEMANLIREVEAEIESLSAKYFMIKNISTATKKLTGLNNEYQRNFGLYNLLRRVALGYVVGIDKNIISHEGLRLTVEKNYLQNADYWVSHCLMATMLWVSDEQEAAQRAVEKAMSIDLHKSSLYFLLMNLHFGRSEAAARWFELYIEDVDVLNIGDEIRILLQAYLYNICGGDEEFKTKMRDAFAKLLSEVREKTHNYDATIQSTVLKFISNYVHKSAQEFADLERSCTDYNRMMDTLEAAEKNTVFAKYFEELLHEDGDAPKNLIERIRNVLYDLINTYDEAELQILRDMDYNEMILKARGDIAAAQKMYQNKYRKDAPQTLGDLMVKLAFADQDEADIRVRKFAVSFLCENIIAAFGAFRQHYKKQAVEQHTAVIDGIKVEIDEQKPAAAINQIREYYKKNRNMLINRDKGVKVLSVFTIGFWAAWLISCICMGISYANNGAATVPIIIFFALSFVGAVGFTVWYFFRRKKVGAKLIELMNASLEKLQRVIEAIKDWRSKFIAADDQHATLINVLQEFSTKEGSIK